MLGEVEGGGFRVSLDPVVGLGSHICSKGLSASRSVEKREGGTFTFFKIFL